MAGEATPVQLAGFAVALRIKGETAGEITGLAEAMLRDTPPGRRAGPRGRHRRHRRRPRAHGQHLHDGGGRGRRRGRAGGQARQPGRASAAARPTCWRRSAWPSTCRRRDRRWPRRSASASVRAAVPPGAAARRGAAPRARHPDRVQLPRPADQPGPPDARAVGVRRPADGAGAAGGAGRPRRAALVFRGEDGLDELTTTARPGSGWSRRRGRFETLDPAELGIARRSGGDLRGVTRQQRLRAAPCSPGSRARCATRCCSTPRARGCRDARAGPADRWPTRPGGLQRAAAALDTGAAADVLDRWVALSSMPAAQGRRAAARTLRS